MRLPIALLLLVLLRGPASAGPDDLAVIIANKAYDHTHEVKYAHRDGEAMRDAAVRALAIPKERVLLVRDASLAQMRALFGTATQPGQIAALLPGRRAQRVWVFYSGHGVPGPAPGGGYERYLLPKDGQPTALTFTAMRLAEVEDALDAIRRERVAPDGQVVLALDACFSGKSDAGVVVPESSAGGPVKLLARPAARLVVLAASRESEVASWDREAQHGLFTDLLLDALFGQAGRDDKGRVTLGHLERHAEMLLARRLNALFPGQGRTQRLALEGPRDTVLASFSGAPPPRDPEATQTAALKCNAYRHLEDADVIARFLDGCRACEAACREALGKRVSELRAREGQCRRELATVEELAKLGGAGKAALVAMSKELRCPTAVARAEAVVAVLALPLPKGSDTAPKAPAVDPKRPAAGSDSAADPALSVVPGSGKSFRDKLSNGQDCAFCPEMVVVPAGRFLMGSPVGEEGRDRDEGPQRTVTIGRPLAVGKFEVTFDEWDACVSAGGCTHRPTRIHRDLARHPVVDVSWFDAQQYVIWIGKATGKRYRLLTEAEWEYAARARSTTRYHFGDSESGLDARAWFGANSGRKLQPVGQKQANAWGLYDMHGNVWEWVEDCWHANYYGAPTDGTAWTTGCLGNTRLLRGGSWDDVPHYLRSADRDWRLPGFRDLILGFRLARTMNPAP